MRADPTATAQVACRLFIAVIGVLLLRGQSEIQYSAAEAVTAADHHARAVEFHLRRRLDEASREYALTLTLDPARKPTANEIAIVRRFAPRLYVTPTEFFPLKDTAAVVHPDQRLVAYHLFWEDDIDFPDDNDPCDHEVVWIRYAEDGRTLERLWTYFHGRVLEGGRTAIRDAENHDMRPRVNVQWGKHGSMPAGWEELSIVADDGDLERKYYTTGQPITLEAYNRGTHRKLQSDGRRAGGHPLGQRLGWPAAFTGDWRQFVDFSRLVDPLTMLDARRMILVSRWNSASINQHFLAYNFRPKIEWPVDVAVGKSRVTSPPLVERPSAETFRLPPKSIFDRTMPRYPNAWFYVDASLVADYAEAVELVTAEVRDAMLLRDVPGPFSNPEGCDADVRLEHLQPWEDSTHRELQHSHAFHMRYYHSALSRQKLERVTLATRAGNRDFYRLAASAHYEVEHTNPNHADVEACPVCGRTGAYGHLQGNLVELVHDPLGLELLLDGTIRDEVVTFEGNDQRAVGGIGTIGHRFAIERHVLDANSGDRNTLRIGVVVISAVR